MLGASLWFCLAACSAERTYDTPGAGGDDTDGNAGGPSTTDPGKDPDTASNPSCAPEGSRRCSGDVPQVCRNQDWVSENKCSGATRACTGAGVCAGFKLTHAGIDALGRRETEPGLVLKEQTLSAAPRACSQKFCVTATVK